MKASRINNAIFFTLTVLLLSLQQLSVPSQQTAPILLPIFLIVGSILLLLRIARFDITSNLLLAGLMLLALVCILRSTAIRPDLISTSSAMYFYVLYILFFIRPKNRTSLTSSLPTIGIIFAIFGVTQYLLQQIGTPFFDIRDIIPENLVLEGYNYSYETSYNTGLAKANGFTFLEPSFFSQFLALFLIIEFHNKRRPLFLAVIFFALIVSFSGTGFIILLAWALSILFLHETSAAKRLALAFLTLASMAIFLASNEYFAARATEFGNADTSAHIRFIAPILNYGNLIANSNLGDLFFGYGPGMINSIDRYGATYNANYMTFLKAAVEYGLFFVALYLIWCFQLIKRSVPNYLVLPLLAFTQVTSSGFLQPITVLTLWLFFFYSKPNQQKKAKNSSPTNNKPNLYA